ncbi:MAG: hypothetical protein JWO25_1061 [Alphaproteobacteria bacterium]|nr:hypothetical protein [Alphaproteobacteria bacterium]MDB5722494.1 hypothetical protein [Alphaproteobacteria bacterium]
MQRVRIGLTGLAFVFILVLLATIIARPSNEPTLTANGLERQANGQAPTDALNLAAPKEPLAELGVAPGNADTNASTPAGQGR